MPQIIAWFTRTWPPTLLPTESASGNRRPLAQQQQRRQQPDESLVVGEADHLARARLGEQARGRVDVEQAARAQVRRREQVRHVRQRSTVDEEAGAVRRAVGLLGALREALNRQYAAQRGELSPLALAIRAIVRAVADFPQVNARFDDEAGVLTLYDAVHLGVATQTDGGLMVPVLRQAQTLNLWDCSQAIAELAAKARAGKVIGFADNQAFVGLLSTLLLLRERPAFA